MFVENHPSWRNARKKRNETKREKLTLPARAARRTHHARFLACFRWKAHSSSPSGRCYVRRETSTETYFSHWLAEVNKCQCTTARLENDSPIVVPLLQSRGVLRMQRCQHHSKLVFPIPQAFKKPNQRQRSGQPKEWEWVRESDLYYSVHLSGFMIISSESETWFWFIYISMKSWNIFKQSTELGSPDTSIPQVLHWIESAKETAK